MSPLRPHPNIAITGTPGVGKTSLAKHLAARCKSLTVINLNKEAEERGFRIEYDEGLKTWEFDEEGLAASMVPSMRQGGYIVDWMHADFWPKDGFFNLIVTLRASNTSLYDRYEERGYSVEKREENLDAEIMETIADENAQYFGVFEEYPVIELQSNTEEEMSQNVEKLVDWVDKWHCRNFSNGGTQGYSGLENRPVSWVSDSDASRETFSESSGLGEDEEDPTVRSRDLARRDLC